MLYQRQVRLLIRLAFLLLILSSLPAQAATQRRGKEASIRAQATSTVNIYNSNLAALSSSQGRFVLGTTNGDPGTPNDNNKRLLFGYPSIVGTSFSTLRIMNGNTPVDYRLGSTDGVGVAPDRAPVSDGSTLTTVWTINNVRVVERLSFIFTADTGRSDLLSISYTLTNLRPTPVPAGLRIMLDDQIGNNDGAPVFVPGWGRQITEQNFDSPVPDYWTAWESVDFDPAGLKARGILRGSGVTSPDRFVVAHWDESLCPGEGPGLYSSAWDYTPDGQTSILCDSAVAMYYNPQAIGAGQSRSINTIYGLTSSNNGLALAPDISAFIASNQQTIQSLSDYARDVSTVGDYFNNKLDEDKFKAWLDLGFNATDTLLPLVHWNLVGEGLEHITTPGYKAALHASWRGWTDEASRHWYKPLYDSIHNNRKLVFKSLAMAGIHYYVEEEAVNLSQDGLKDWAVQRLAPGQGTPFADAFGQPSASLGASYQSNLARERDELLTRLSAQPLTPAQVAAYRADLAARQQANSQLVAALGSHRDLLWANYQRARADEQNWWKPFIKVFVKWGVVGAATLIWDGPGYYIASIGTSAVQTIYEAVEDARALQQDQQMASQAYSLLTGRLSTSYDQVALNTVNGLNLIRASDTPQIASGGVSVAAMKSFGQSRWWPYPHWSEQSAQIDLAIANSETFPTTFQTSAAYTRNDWWNGDARLLPEGQSLDLPGQGAGTATIPLKSTNWGETPNEGNAVDITVMGASETGLYPVATLQPIWQPTRVPLAAAAIHTQDMAVDALPELPFPLVAGVSAVPGTTDQQIIITVTNPYTLTVAATITQTLPQDVTLVDGGGAQTLGSLLSWFATLQAGESTQLRARIHWGGAPGTTETLSGTQLQFQDPATGQGDTYTAPDMTLTAVWPLQTSIQPPLTWQIGTTTSIPVTLTALSATESVHGQLSITIATPEGQTLWSGSQSVSVPAGGSQSLTLSVPTPLHLGYAEITGEVVLNTASRGVLDEVINIHGYDTYLPLMR